MIDGRWDPRFDAVRDAFGRNFAEHGEVGAALCVCLDGRAVVDAWGGHVDKEKTRPWRPETLVAIFSVGKAVTALAALQLVDRGQLDLDASVSRYWPEFAAGGKDGVTVRQLLSHRAGLPAIREPLPDEAMLEWDTMTKALANQEPWWPPGSRHGYHVNTFGYLVGEVVRRTSGRSLGTFVRDEIAGPLNADFHVGLAEPEDARTAEFLWGELPPVLGDEDSASEQHRMIRNAYANPPGLSGVGWVNRRAWRAAEIPSTNGHATARSVARIYAALAAGGTIDGVRVIGIDALREAVVEHSAGDDAVLRRPSRFGLGFQLTAPHYQKAGGYLPLVPSPGAFGHFGAGGSLGFADPEAGLAFGYVMNAMGPRWNNPRPRALIEALYGCL